jgi:hypothetical protein
MSHPSVGATLAVAHERSVQFLVGAILVIAWIRFLPALMRANLDSPLPVAGWLHEDYFL